MRIPRIILVQILVSLLVVVLTGLMSWWWQQAYWVDLNPPLCSSQLILAGENPYSSCYTNYIGLPSASYPMTTLIALLPFAILPGKYLPIALIWGAFNGLLVFGLLRKERPWLFLVFLSPAYWTAFAFHQFSPLITAVYLLPNLLPLALLKPQIGLPVIINHLTRRRLIATLGFVVLTFIIFPNWIPSWFSSGKNYDGIIPILVFPLNLFFLLSFLKFRDHDVRFLFMMACVPQRSIYDVTALYLLPRNLKQILLLCFVGWLSFLPQFTVRFMKVPANEVKLSIILVYIPLLIMLIFSQKSITVNDSESVNAL